MSEERKGRRMRLTVITTKVGDGGETYLAGGFVVKKNHPRVKAYGSVDELASFIGYAVAVLRDEGDLLMEFVEILEKIQHQLVVLAGDLARVIRPSDRMDESQKRVTEKMTKWIEELEKKYLKELEPLEDFIIPGGTKEASLLHILRTVARRCEREIVELSQIEKVNPNCVKYINRLSDLFFIIARVINKRKNVKESVVVWKQP